ncbi:MAG: heparinase II/III family protein [Candidatus Omnitrophica bacterium]|nr:heparinase II/III family protein [Candidatus Omnitrophota bacterium]
MKIANLIGRSEKSALLLEELPDIHFQPYGGTLPDPLEIKLATQNIRMGAKIDWFYPYADREDIFALNRFGWTLSLLLQYPSPETAEFALNSILYWIRQMQEPQGGPAWESYSVAERLANWPFILLIAKKLSAISDDARGIIAESMAKQVNYLLNNLELNGIFTNNHILNDARGLYIGGVVLNHNIALRKSKELFSAWTEKVFYPDGMMRDGSSHYQYLLCQRFEQVYYLSCFVKDTPFSGFMEKWARLMRDCCDFFSVYDRKKCWRMPMFGDISPDFSPEWLSPDAKAGWEELKKWLNWTEMGGSLKKQSGAPENKGDFVRFDSSNVVIFWHIARENAAYLNHGHYDLGSFVLFYKGIQIFADPGQFSYDTKHAFAKSAKAHNSVLLDSLGPFCENHKLNLFNAYHPVDTRFSVLRSDEYLSLEIMSEGFKRLPVPVEWSRKFSVYSDKMVIADDLKSVGNNILESRFQISPGLEIKEEDGVIGIYHAQTAPIRLKVADLLEYKCNLIRGSNTNIDDGWVSSEYGAGSSAIVVVFHRELSLAKTYIYEIRWQNVSS